MIPKEKMYDWELGLETIDDWNRMCMEMANHYREARDLALAIGEKKAKANPDICDDMMNKWIEAVDLKPVPARGEK